MIDLKEVFEKCDNYVPETTDSYLEKLSPVGEYSKEFKQGLHLGFNYALAMMKEELGEDYWKNKKTDIPMVKYYHSLMINKNVKYR